MSDIDARRAALRARFPVWSPVTLSDFLHRSAAKYGDRPFVLTDERALSYGEADAWASELADGLAALGVRPGVRVGMLMANYLEFVPVKFAIARAGAVAIPFNYLLTRHPGVSQAFVVGVPDDRWGDVGCAWIVPEPGAEVDADDLLAVCKEKLARFKVPKHILFLSPAELPTTPTGKVQKFRLAQRAADRIEHT